MHESGEARAAGLPAGRHKGSVLAQGYSIGDLDVEIPKAGEARVEVRLARSSPVRLRVLDEKGNLAPWVGVTITDAKGAGPAWRFVYSKPRGTSLVITEWTTWASTPPNTSNLSVADGRIEGLAVGKYSIRATSHSLAAEARFEVVAGTAGEVELRFGR